MNFVNPPVPRRRTGAALVSAAIALWIVLGPATPAKGQGAPTSMPAITPPSAAAPDLQIKVSDVSGEGRLIRVPVNKAVLVEFSQPVREMRLAKPDIAEVNATSPKQILVTGKSFGSTQLIVWFNENHQRVFDIAVELQLDRIEASIRAAAPRSNVKVHALLDSVVLSGTVPDADTARRVADIAAVFSRQVLNHLKVAGVQQVLLRCTVAEVNRRSIRQMGFNGWMAGDNFKDMFVINNLDQINPSNMGAPEAAVVNARIPFLVGEKGIPVTARPTLSFGFPNVQMQVFIQALRENGLLRVLAEPNLVTVSGQEANFLAGGEFPVPVPNADGITISYREFGVKLRFTPAVLNENNIRLHIAPEVSEPDFSTAVTVLGTTVPGLSQRRVDTTVELGSGQTFAVGGLLSERTRAVSRKVPALGDIPIIGALFRSVDFQQDESELVVLVTPELVEPISSDQVTHVPGAAFVQPNDYELFLLGEIEGEESRNTPTQRPAVNNRWPVKPSELYGPGGTMRVRGPLGPSGGEGGE
ncbi:MAG: type II and III secretion system protein family protein [Phycisphaerae bacterium]